MFEFSLNSPEVLQLRAVQQSDDIEQSVDWRISCSRQRFTFRGRPMIPVIGTLQASGPAGWGDVSVASMLVVLGDEEAEDLDEVIVRSDATETLYDFARGHLMPLLMTVGAPETLPRKSPRAEVSVFGEPNSAEPQDLGPAH